MKRIAVLAFILLAACGKPTTGFERNPNANTTANGDIPLAGNAITIGTLKPPEGGTYFDLLAPALPNGVKADPLRASLTGPGGTLTLTAFHITGPTWKGTPVTGGTYTLTYLDEAGNPTKFATTVQVEMNRANYLVIGGILVSPISATASDRSATQGLHYVIEDSNGNKLKTALADLNVAVDLPAGTWAWSGLAFTGSGQLEPLWFESTESITPFEWGSIYVRKDTTQSAELKSATGIVLDPALADRTEYLLPTASQAEGCRVYDTVRNQYTVFRRTLCSDAITHAVVDLR